MASNKADKAKIKARKEAREQENQQKRMVQIAVGIIVIVIIGIAAYFYSSSRIPAVAEERLELDPVRGNPDAPITIVEYAAFGCRACRAWHDAGVVDDILTQFEGQVKFIFRDLPVINPTWDQAMGEIAQCAFDQGNDAFWLAHDTLYEDTDQGNTSQADAIELVLADNPALDGDALRNCVNSNTHHLTVRYDMDRPEAAGLRGTPVWFINGNQMLSDNPATLTDLIQAELES